MNEQLTPDTIKQLRDLVDRGAFPSMEAAVDFSVELVDQLHFLAEKEAVERGIADADAGRFYEGDRETHLAALKEKHLAK